MRFKRILFLSALIIFVLFIFLKNSTDNKDSLKFNELDEKINEIEKLIKSSRESFNIIKKALLELKNNHQNNNNLANLKTLLQILQSKSENNQTLNPLKWSKRPYKICNAINTTKSDIDMLNVYEKLDFKDIDGGVWKQGFDLKYDSKFPQRLKVFVVPHSHLDPGWVKTLDEYFVLQTKPILDSMLQFLLKEPEMKFIHAEISYFQMWWQTLNDNDRENVKRLIKNKQLEIVTGGWVMTDEANSHFYSMLNQLTDGHVWLKKHLNYSPKMSWSIDPFGYSEMMPYILKKSGIDNLVIQRVHYIIKKELSLKKQLEFLWKQSWDSKSAYLMPCQIMPFYSYDIPHTCGPNPAICCQFDFIRMHQYGCPWGKSPVEITNDNIDERSETLMDQYRKKSELFDNGNILLIPLGDDFRYQTEKEWRIQFDNYKKLMNYMNNKKEWNIEVKFATISEYFEAYNKNKIQHLPTLTGDMFSYADRLDHYWTGYFTSRPLLKGFDRILMTNLRTVDIVLSLLRIYQRKYNMKSFTLYNESDLKEKINLVRRTLSLFQHHDAIAGTAKNHVMEDYGKRLIEAINVSQNIFIQSAQGLLEKNDGILKMDKIIFDLDDLVGSYGEEKKTNFLDLLVNNERYVYLFNSLAQPRQVVVNIPIKTHAGRGIKVVGSGNQIMHCQMTPFTTHIGNYNPELNFVSFKLNIGPLAFEKLQIIVSQDILSDNNCIPVEVHVYSDDDITQSKMGYKVIKEASEESKFLIVQNLVYTLHISQLTGSIERVKTFYSDKVQELKIKFKTYGARNTQETSGAYIFTPDGNGQILESQRFPPIVHFKGSLFEEVHIKYKYVTQRIKIYHVDGALANAIDIENIVDIRESKNLELSMSIMTDTIIPSDIFYTDSNCFQFIKRKTLPKLPIQGNVYPMSCGSYVESHTATNTFRMSVFSKQPNGVLGGQIPLENKVYAFLEVFLDRRLNQDDNRGLFEPLLDNKVTSMGYRIVLEGWQVERPNIEPYSGELSVSGYQLLNDITYGVHQLYIKSDLSNKVSNNLVSQKSLLTGLGLPCDYHIVSMRTEENNDSPTLTLQRVKLNCDAKYISEGSCNIFQRKSILFKSMFDDLMIKYVNKVSLTGIDIHEGNILPEEVKVDVMEMETVALQFELK